MLTRSSLAHSAQPPLVSCIVLSAFLFFFPLSSYFVSTPVPTQTSSPVAALHRMAVTCARHRGIVRYSCGMYEQVCSVPEEESSSAKATVEASAPVPSPVTVLGVFLKTVNNLLIIKNKNLLIFLAFSIKHVHHSVQTWP